MSFADDLKDGKKGEQLVQHLLESSGRFVSVWNCSDDKYFQSKDIDLMGITEDGRIAKYEVKTDRQAHETGNIVWEQTTSGNIGCFAKTESDYIMYYIAGNGRLYCFKTDSMRRYVQKRKTRLIHMGDNAQGYLLNIGELLKAKQMTRIL